VHTAQQQRFLSKAVIKGLQLQPVVSLLSIADDSEERLIASALGTDTLHMLVCKTEADVTLLLQHSPPVGLAFVSQEVLNTATLSDAVLDDTAVDAQAVFARDCFNEKQSPLLHFLLKDTLIVADVVQARELHAALKNNNTSSSSTVVPRIIARSGHAVSTAGVTSVLQVDSITDQDGTVMTALPYFAARSEDTATLHTAAAAGQKRKSSSSRSGGSSSSGSSSKGKGKAKQAKTKH
jgi:chromosome segregation ATPase